jgi:hypothetical protein
LPDKPRAQIAHPARSAAFVYGGLSLVAAVAFLLVTTFTGDYPLVARYGGAAWIFLLLMIVLMPIVIPRVLKRGRKPQGPPATGGPQAVVACPLDEPIARPVDTPAPQLDDAGTSSPVEEPPS